MVTFVKEVMTSHLFSIPLGANCLEAEKMMKEKRIRHLPVVDKKNQLVGVLSQRDLKALSHLAQVPVENVMSAPVKFVSSETLLKTAVFQMLEDRISCLVISDGQEKAIGIVTTADLLWYLGHLLSDEKEEGRPLLSASAQQTIGELAHKLSLMGI